MTRLRIALAAAALLAGAATVAVARPHGPHGGPHEGPFGWDRFAEKHDANEDDVVTRDELATSMASERFDRLDENGDGSVTEDEFRGALAGRVLGHLAFRADADRNGELTQAEWSAFLAEQDEDGDGALDFRHYRRRGPEGAEGEADAPRDFPGDADGDGSFEVAEAQALFARFDDDGNGVVTEEELPITHRRGDSHGRHGLRGGHAGFLLRLDTDGDGSVSRAEWDSHVEQRQDDRAERHAERFERLDTNGDGSLSRQELEVARPRGPHGRR